MAWGFLAPRGGERNLLATKDTKKTKCEIGGCGTLVVCRVSLVLAVAVISRAEPQRRREIVGGGGR